MPVAYHQSFKHSDSARIPSLCQAQRAGPPHPRPAQSLGSGHPCPGSETLFLVLTRRWWRAGFWSWVAWVPVRGHLSGHMTWDKSLHFLTCAMSVAIVPVSRGFGPSLNSRQPTHTSTLCVYSLFPCRFPGSALSTFQFLPLKTNTLPRPRSTFLPVSCTVLLNLAPASSLSLATCSSHPCVLATLNVSRSRVNLTLGWSPGLAEDNVTEDDASLVG